MGLECPPQVRAICQVPPIVAWLPLPNSLPHRSSMVSLLVVDDCPVDRRLIGALLRGVPDWAVEYASDGREALEKIEVQCPHVVVTDLQMPHLDGLGLVSAISERFPVLPVVLITSHGSEQIALQALKAGAAYFSPKRALSRDLVPALHKVLGVSESLSNSPKASIDVNCMDVTFELDNDDALIGRLVEHLQVNLPDWTETNQFQIAMALHEALVNAMHHGNLEVGSDLKDADDGAYERLVSQRRMTLPFSQRRVQIQARYSNDEIEFSIADQGPGFKRCCVADPTCVENLERLSGRGLLLIRSFMDEVRHNDLGNCITMVKRRPSV